MKPLGPVQLYEAFKMAGVKRLSVLPLHTGLLLVGAGAGGLFTTTATVAVALVQPATVTVSE